MKTIKEEDKNRIKYKTTLEAISKIETICAFIKENLIKESRLVSQYFLEGKAELIQRQMEIASKNFQNEYAEGVFLEKVVEIAKEFLECLLEA